MTHLKEVIDETEYLKLKRSITINGKQYLKYIIISAIVNSACALAFYYIEHCVSMVPASYSRAERVIYETCDMVNGTHKNDSVLLRDQLVTLCEREKSTIERMRRRECKWTKDAFWKWLDYVYVLALTIGR